MPNPVTSLFEKIAQRRALRRWQRLAAGARDAEIKDLRSARRQARNLKQALNQLLQIADARLMHPMIGMDNLPKPMNSDWSYRPEIWRGPVFPNGIAPVRNKSMLGHEATLFHDCNHAEIGLRQIRITGPQDLAPFGLHLDVYNFEGSFLSLVLDLPETAITGLKKTHLLRVDAVIEMENPTKIFARLNVKHGPNTEQQALELQVDQNGLSAEFDLAYANLNEARLERIWVDLIFEDVQMNAITLRDLTFSRRPRAQM